MRQSVIPDADLTIQWLATNFLEPSIIAGALASLAHDPSAVIVVGTGGHWGLPGNLNRNVFSSSLTWANLGKEKTKQIMAERLLPTFALLKSFAKSHIVIWRTPDIAHWIEKKTKGTCPARQESLEKVSTFIPDYQLWLHEVVLQGLQGSDVLVLDRSSSTDVRPDAHPSGVMKQIMHFDDCQHWCLPGVPDDWNAILINYRLCQHQQQRR